VVQVGPKGYFPLAARLYLPSTWLRECAGVAAKLIPPDERDAATKSALALRLIDELRSEEMPPLAGEAGYLDAPELRDGLADRGLAAHAADSDHVAEALLRFDWLRSELGLDHFEGRTWNGWHHHVSLVFAAYGFLCGEASGQELPPFPSPDRRPLWR
jgi:hypothetical protein